MSGRKRNRTTLKKKIDIPSQRIQAKDIADLLIIEAVFIAGFILVYGVNVLKWDNIDWLMQGGDLTQHYLGWVAYRKSRWFFPIGLSDYLSYPQVCSVIFTDSIPVLCVFFKIFSGILPENFQFFGFYGLLSFILSGFFIYRVLRTRIANRVALYISSAVFVLVPVVLMWMFRHTSLAGHWIILMFLEPLFNYGSRSERQIYIYYGVGAALACSVHLYFMPMGVIILAGYYLIDIFNKKGFFDAFIGMGFYILSSLVAVFLLGGFSTNTVSYFEGLGDSSFNLNSFFNSRGYSKIFKEMKTFGAWPDESYGYLGAGIILLCLVCVIIIFLKRKQAISYLKTNRPMVIALCFVFFSSLLLSLCPYFALGDKPLLPQGLPESVMLSLRTFRATGRFGWIGVYIIMILSILIVVNNINNKVLVTVLISIILLLQVFDTMNLASDKHKKFSGSPQYENKLANNAALRTVFENPSIKHIYLLDGFYIKDFYPWAYNSLQNNKTLNQFYFARPLLDIDKYGYYALSEGDSEDVFIIKGKPSNDYYALNNYNFYDAGDYIVLYSGELMLLQ